MENTTPRPKPAPPKVGPHAPQPEVVEEAKDLTPVPEERCLCGRYLSQISEGCVFGKHKRPFVAKPHLTVRPLSGNAELLNLKKDLTKHEPKKPVRRNSRPSKEKN